MTKEKLTQLDWLQAAFRGLAERGPKAIAIVPLAKELKATKGSFYWHFKDLAEFKQAMLSLWLEKVASEIIAEVQAEPEPARRFELLTQLAARPAPKEFGGYKIETAMRAWALSDPDVDQQLAKIDGLRMQFLKGLLDDMGLDDTETLARLVYGAYIGLEDLRAKGRAEMESPFAALSNMVKGLTSATKGA